MDAIDRFEYQRRRALLGALVFLVAVLLSLLWVHLRLQARADQTDAQLKVVIALLNELKAGHPQAAASQNTAHSWIGGRSFVSGSDKWCDRVGKMPESEISECEWRWHSLGGLVVDPVSVIGEAHKAGRPVVVIVSAGHDDQALKLQAKREFGTNFNLAARRSMELVKSLVTRATGSASCGSSSGPSTVHCVAIPQGSPSLKMSEEERAAARTPRLTIIAGA